MCQIQHDILLLNIKTDEVIYHEILLIKGSVTKKCSVESVSINNLETNKIAKTDISSRSDYFKLLVQLQPGQNKFEIIYCNKSYKLNINFKKSSSLYQIQPIYIVCKDHDGCFNTPRGVPNDSSAALKIIELNIKLIQCLYAEKLLESGFGRKTFSLKSDCLIFPSKLSIDVCRQLDEISLWNEFAYEIINSELGTDTNLKFIAFIGCTQYNGYEILNDYSYENIKKHTKAHAALGGGGLALFGSGCFYSWPREFDDIIDCFKNTEKINLKLFLDESNYRRTFGGCYATSLGAVCHEIGHIFDLGHTQDGIMGNGFDYVNHFYISEKFTENLPERKVDLKSDCLNKDNRLTKIKKNSNKFLEKYHEQKLGDSTYFVRNCAIILAHHKWLNYTDDLKTESEILLNKNFIKSNNYLILVEIREKINGLVLEYFDLTKENVKIFELPMKSFDSAQHNVFVITKEGTVKLIE